MKIIRPISVQDTGTFTRATSATYYDKTGKLSTAAVDTPRFSYDPSLLIPEGLLEEKAATNILLYSEQLDNAAWTLTNSAISANAGTAPDSNFTAELFTAITAAGNISQTVAVNSGISHTLSCFVKANLSSEVRLIESVSGAQADFSLTNQTATITAGTATATIKMIGTAGWYRITLSFTSASTSASVYVQNNNGSASSDFYVWGAQLEAASTSSSYITTTSTTVTRSADVNTACLLSSILENDAAAWSASTVYITDAQVIYNHRVYQSATGKQHTVTVTIASPGVFTWVTHGLIAGTPIVFATTGALPTGIVAGTIYYVSATGLTADSFQISATVSGSVINTSGIQSGVHTATASSNYNKLPPDNPTLWVDIGATNKWKMFDDSVQSQTTNSEVIFVAVKSPSRIDSLCLLNIATQKVRVTLRDSTDGVVYDQIFEGISTEGIIDWWFWFTEEIKQRVDFLISNLPLYGATATLNIMLYGVNVKCGAAVIGKSREIGVTEFSGAKVGIQDYSIKTKDTFGNYVVTPRAFNKRANFTVIVDSREVDFLQNLLASYRATPIVYIGESVYGATIVYGFYKSFDIDIGYFDGDSVCTLEVEGLT